MKGAAILKEWAPIAFTAANAWSQPVALPANELVRRFLLDCTFRIALTGGTTDPAKVEDMPLTFLSEVEITLAGKAFRRFNPIDAYYYAYLRNLVAPPTTSPAISGTGNYDFAFQIPIDCSAKESKHLLPDKSILRTTPKLNPQIRVKFYSATTDLVTGGDRTVTVSLQTVTILAEYPTENVDPVLMRTMVSQTHTWSAASADSRVELDVGEGKNYRGLLLRARHSSVRSNAVVNRVTLVAGTDDRIFDLTWDMAQRELTLANGLAAITGILLLDFDKSKRWADTLDTSKLAHLRFKFDVDAPSSSEIVITPDVAWQI